MCLEGRHDHGSELSGGEQSEERLAAKIEADAAAMRSRGYLVASTQTFSLPVIGAPSQTANWYRVTFELASPESR
jgi:hypothetical protein